jgi:hypothetical protein
MKSTFETSIWIFFHRPVVLVELLIQSGTVLWEMLIEATFNQTNFWFIFSQSCDIKSEFSYIICSYLRRLLIQNLLKCTGTLQIFINPLPNPIGIFYLKLRSIYFDQREIEVNLHKATSSPSNVSPASRPLLKPTWW